VLRAQLAAIRKIKAGASGKAADKAARDLIAKAGYGKNFGHGTGHGISLEVHSGPSLSPRVDHKLKAGNVITVEPGIYISGWGGVRIEDDVLVTRSGCRVLNRAQKSCWSYSPGPVFFLSAWVLARPFPLGQPYKDCPGGFLMREKYIKSLIRLVEESDIESLEVSSWGRKVRITQRLNPGHNGHNNGGGQITVPVAAYAPPASAPNPSPSAVVDSSQPAADNTSNLVEIKSPMVGTFYRRRRPTPTRMFRLMSGSPKARWCVLLRQ